MTEMHHPPLNPKYQEEPSIEEAFAGKMTTLLAAYKNDSTTINSCYMVTYPVTDRVDIMDGKSQISGALRIKKIQTIALAAVLTAQESEPGGSVKLGTPTQDYSVLALEYGEPKTVDLDVADDDDFIWNPYVMSVANYETGVTDLLDGASGTPLSGGDFAEASYRLDFFGRKISDEAYECFIRGYDDELAIDTVPLPVGKNRNLETMFKDFNPIDTHVELYEQHACFPGCPLEIHPPSNQN